MSDNTFVIASIRRPVHHFLSLYDWSNAHMLVERLANCKLNKWQGIRIFLESYDLIQSVYTTYTEYKVQDHIKIDMLRPNLQLFNLGVDTLSTNYEEVLQLAEHIGFFVVAEEYNKSMVILRDKLCCSFQDLVYRKQKKTHDFKETIDIPTDIEEAIIRFNSKDMLLYEIALNRLYKEIVIHPQFLQLLNIYKWEVHKYEQKCTSNSKQSRICQPTNINEVYTFMQNVRNIQKEKLLKKLRQTFSEERNRSFT